MHNRPFYSGNRFYIAYRKIRFLAKKGSLFSLSKQQYGARIGIPGGTFNTILFNSCFLFIIAYLVIYILTLFITGYTAILFNIPVVVYHYDVDYLIRGIDWTPDSVSGVFSSGPIAMFVLSLFLLILYKAVETESGMLRLLLLWLIFHAITRFSGEILAGAILGKGFGFVIIYMFVMDTGKVILTILMLVAMFTAGLFLTRLSLYTANIYFNDLLKPFRNKFIINQFILPFIIGNMVILLVKLPDFSYFDMTINASMILFLIPMLVRGISFEDFYFDEEPKKISKRIGFAVAAVILLILFRLILGFGIRL